MEEIQMKTPKIAPIVLGTTLLLGGGFAQDDSAMATREDSWTREMRGLVTDNFCKGRNLYKGHTLSSCARKCAKQAGYALVVGDTTYALRGDSAELDKFAG